MSRKAVQSMAITAMSIGLACFMAGSSYGGILLYNKYQTNKILKSTDGQIASQCYQIYTRLDDSQKSLGDYNIEDDKEIFIVNPPDFASSFYNIRESYDFILNLKDENIQSSQVSDLTDFLVEHGNADYISLDETIELKGLIASLEEDYRNIAEDHVLNVDSLIENRDKYSDTLNLLGAGVLLSGLFSTFFPLYIKFELGGFRKDLRKRNKP